MGALLHLAPAIATKDAVDRAWATYRAMQIAEVDDPALVNDVAHQEATEEAYARYFRLYSEWSRR